MTEEKLCPLCGDPANINKSSKLTIEALLAERDLYRELVNNTSIHLAELKAEVERLTAKAQMDGEIALSKSVIDEVITDEKIEKLEAEVARVKSNYEYLSRDWSAACELVKEHCPCPIGTNHITVGIPLLAERARRAEAEVEQLKAHTWEQEREAIVCFTMAKLSSVNIGDLQFFRKLVNEILCSIAQGEHWPKGKYGDSLVGSKTYRRPIEETNLEETAEEICFWDLPKEKRHDDE